MSTGKPRLDAMTDQSLAWIRDARPAAHPATVHLGGQLAGILAAQFPGQQETAGRVVMCVAQVLLGLCDQLGLDEAQTVAGAADVLALAAEQTVREAP